MNRSSFLGLMLIFALTAGYILRVTWHDVIVILLWMTAIGSALLVFCYAVHKSPLGPLGTRAGCQIIDGGYWAGFAIVLLCLFHGSASAASAPIQRPAFSQPPTPHTAVPAQYTDPCYPNMMVLRGTPLTAEQKQAEEAACGK